MNHKSLIIGLFIGLICCVRVSVLAQTDKVLVDLADEMFEFGDYEDALGLYLQATQENPENVRAQYQSGICFLRTTSGKAQAFQYFLTAHDLDPEFSNMILYQIAESYRYAYKFDEAIEYYGKFKEEVNIHRRIFTGIDTDELIKRSDRRIFECENAKEFLKNPVRVKIENLGEAINSEETDYAPVLTESQKTIIFTSRRAGGRGILKDTDNKYFEDLWIANKEGDKWGAPKNMGEVINTETHESNLGLSPNGQRLYIYKTDNAGDIYFSELKNGKWTKPKSLGKLINSDYREISAVETSDGKQLFISSDRPGGAGGADIYVCKKDSKGNWTAPTALSSAINTEYDEEGPYFDVNTSTLYFSSKGHKGMGGHDLYRSEFVNGEWSEPQNLGYPINTTDDDLYFFMASDGKTGYYASFKEDSHGENDLYKIYPVDGSEEPIEEPVDTTPVVIAEPIDTTPVVAVEESVLQPVQLKVDIVDYETETPVNIKLELVNKATNEKIFEGEVNGLFEYTFEESAGLSLIIVVEGGEYQFQSIRVEIPISSEKTQFVNKWIGMRRPKVNVINILRNIYFDFDKHTLAQQSFTELDKLLNMMNEHADMTLEIAGHTDFIGGHDYNQQLSTSRAKAVYTYLKGKGIDGNRMKVKGYGEERPLASNDDEEEGRALNRRTEFIILSK